MESARGFCQTGATLCACVVPLLTPRRPLPSFCSLVFKPEDTVAEAKAYFANFVAPPPPSSEGAVEAGEAAATAPEVALDAAATVADESDVAEAPTAEGDANATGAAEETTADQPPA